VVNDSACCGVRLKRVSNQTWKWTECTTADVAGYVPFGRMDT
jgi:hypothetical protein